MESGTLTRGHRSPGQLTAAFNRASVERAFVVHYGEGYVLAEGGGYVVTTGRATIRLRDLREAAIFVHAVAEGKRLAALAVEQ